jgi:hypothetical protein
MADSRYVASEWLERVRHLPRLDGGGAEDLGKTACAGTFQNSMLVISVKELNPAVFGCDLDKM